MPIINLLQYIHSLGYSVQPHFNIRGFMYSFFFLWSHASPDPSQTTQEACMRDLHPNEVLRGGGSGDGEHAGPLASLPTAKDDKTV